MRVLIACEFTGITRDAFCKLGHDAWSCDLLPSNRPGNHIQGDVLNVLDQGWDLMVAHPPCQYLSYAGNRWFKTDPTRWDKALMAFWFFMQFVEAPIPMKAIENPRGLTWQWYKPPDQQIEPYYFGHKATKATGLWLHNLPPLMATLIHSNPDRNWTKYKGSHNGKSRSKSWEGIAAAMADQWGH